MSGITDAAAKVGRTRRGLLPSGQLLTPEVWARRHRGIVWLLWLHVAGIAAFAVARGNGLGHGLEEASLVALFALPAAHPAIGRRARSAAAVPGLVTPTDVFDHPAALRAPWNWALIHGGFVLAASVAYLTNWRLSEHQAIEISRLVSRLEGLARTDPLTGVPNRRVWEEELPRELERARRTGAGVCLAMIDLDDFKAYNDRFGHQAGDLVLKEGATAWRAEVRSTDLLARHGGEEFVLLLPACALDDAIRIVERLRMVAPLVTCSVGLARWDFQEGEAELIQRADQALYTAKAEGRNRHVLAS
jgi:diguanylate cyclase (GGDEF)-like protein